MSKKVLITGGNGMLGQYFGIYPFCHITSKEELDVTNVTSVLKYIRSFKPTSIIHLAAVTDVDFCEQNPHIAYKTNVEGTKNIAYAAKVVDCLVVYISTASIFSGQGFQPFKINDIPSPNNVYARSKLEGEKAVQEIAPKYLILRTGWIFGGFERDKKFVSLIANQIWNGSKTIKAIYDVFGCPTYGKDLAAAILQLIDKKKRGVIHLVNRGYASRFEIAFEIAKILNPTVKVEAAKSNDFPSFNAPRPKFEVILPSLILRPWQQALEEYLKEWLMFRKS